MTGTHTSNYRQKLADLFSGYRAEWISERVFELFTEPSYFPQLTTSHPCFLVGGRGTGKTTVLRCLSYEGQAALRQRDTVSDGKEANYVGMYYRANTNRVRAFEGDELDLPVWNRVFAHYINLEFCGLILDFLQWYETTHDAPVALSHQALAKISASLLLDEDTQTISELSDCLELSRLRFEASINNVSDAADLGLTLQAAPIDILMGEVRLLPQFASKHFFFLIDEYENFSGEQQRVINTLVKHCGELYSFKIGVRELGFRERSTLNKDERLSHPADYDLIDITRELSGRFSEFATSVCASRLAQVIGDVPSLRPLLPELTPEDEARILGVEHMVERLHDNVAMTADRSELVDWLRRAEPLEAFTVSLRAQAEGRSLSEKLSDILGNPKKWKEEYGNYKHAYLFAIRKGKRGIRKYFCGWRVYCLLAGSNIRFLLELVDQAFNHHLDEGGDLREPVSPDLQTKAAQLTGQVNLRELEGLSLEGAKLTRLLLGLGRVFQVMAEDPVGHTPEVNQFHMAPGSEDSSMRATVEGMLDEGIMHLALVRFSASKLQQPSNLRDYDYTIHPIFSAFLGFGYRRKRKVALRDRDLNALVNTPSAAITEIVGRQNRTGQSGLPEQLNMFAEYYGQDD